MSEEKEKEYNREYVARGISGLPEWWEQVDKVAKANNVSRSVLVRIAVDEYLKGSGKRTVASWMEPVC